MPKELFEKYFLEYQEKIQNSQQELISLRSQNQQKDRERKLSELTLAELSTLNETNKTFRTVGKMFMEQDVKSVVEEKKNLISNLTKEIEAIQKVALKVDADLKDYERNFKSLLEKANAQ